MKSSPDPRRSTPVWASGPWPALILLVVAILVRVQTFGNPAIELDEQLYRLIGERMLEGYLPYVDTWDTKPIGLFLAFAAAAKIGGPAALSYQIMATLCVWATAWPIHAMARRVVSGNFAPLLAASLYIFWLNLLQGEGGQASVIYNAPVAIAALLTLRQLCDERRGALLRDGLLAMLLIGVALQIKYTVVVEGGFFGLALLWAGWRSRLGVGRLALYGLLWALVAALPTLIAWASYVAMGHGEMWVFSNFRSVFLRAPLPADAVLEELAGGLGSMLLLFVAAAIGLWRRPRGNGAVLFALCWLAAATLALVLIGTYSPHYWIPLVPPCAILAVPALQAMRRTAIGFAVVALVASQALVGFFIYSKGDARTVAHMVAAIGPVPNCLFVFDGFPALYQETKSCLPSRFLFPNMLNGSQLVGAIGVDPTAEVERIMAAKPDAVVLDEPRWALRNMATNAIVDRELAAHYRLALREETGKGRFRLVYRRKD